MLSAVRFGLPARPPRMERSIRTALGDCRSKIPWTLQTTRSTSTIDRAKPLNAKPGRYRPPDTLLKFLEDL